MEKVGTERMEQNDSHRAAEDPRHKTTRGLVSKA
jgi:hypothetical protein